MREINIERGQPDVLRAMSVLKSELVTARSLGLKQAKIIHGYGSKGTGGAIRTACRRELVTYKNNGTVRDYCPGELFGPMSDEGRRIVAKYPQLKGDSDWARGNDGITVVVF